MNNEQELLRLLGLWEKAYTEYLVLAVPPKKKSTLDVGDLINKTREAILRIGNELNAECTPIYVWPDYIWVEVSDYDEEGYRGHGDDFMLVNVPPDVQDIDTYLEETRPQG